nr:alpha-L-rhamnosidase C-terminal domain-containing protein [Candidatus Sigynarchaeota archaeon]
PHFTCHGFRYVKVENWPESIKPDNFTSIAVYSDLEQTGFFECSSALVNQLVRNTLWGLKSNFMDIPTDCPTRERAGWTGDIAQFALTASYLMDTRKFLAKWLRDVALQQRGDGRVASIVPPVGLPHFMDGAAGWADAAITIPYTLYQMYGEKEILADQYECMTKWMDFLARRAKKRHLSRLLKRNPCHEYTIDAGFHWGEWLEPGHVMALDAIKGFLNPDFEVATACYGHSSQLMANIATILGKDSDAEKYRVLAENIKKGYRYNYTKDGMVTSKRHCRHIRPVAYNLLPDEDTRRIVKRLNDLIVANEYRVGTGFLTTPHLLPTLSDHGFVETAYKVLENEKRPGWMYEILHGATTIWENWNGIDESGKPKDSLNHYLMGCVCAWLFSHVAGITPLSPGFKKIKIKPFPGGSLSRATCRLKTVSGMITTSWTRDGDTFTLKIQVPSSAEVHLPDGTIKIVEKGDHDFSCKLPH